MSGFTSRTTSYSGLTISGWWFQPLWKIWVRQLGWLFPIYGKSFKIPWFQSPPTRYGSRYVRPCPFWEHGIGGLGNAWGTRGQKWPREKWGEVCNCEKNPARLWIASWSPRFLAEKYTSPLASPVAQYCSIEELCYYSTGLFEDIEYYSILSIMVQFEDSLNPRTMKNHSIWPKLRRAMKTFHQFIRTGNQE